MQDSGIHRGCDTLSLINEYIKKTIHSAGLPTFREMNEVHHELGSVASKFMDMNPEYVLNHLDSDYPMMFAPPDAVTSETQKAKDILETGFTKNQMRLLNRLKEGIFASMPDCCDVPTQPSYMGYVPLAFLLGIFAGAVITYLAMVVI